MKKILISGGSGYVGRHLIRELLNRYADIEILSVSRSEGMISQLMMECQDERLKIIMADIRDRETICCYLRDIDTVIHLAALKRVDLCEEECHQAAENNVIGTMNILDNFYGDTFILMSTDKAVEPANCYGATKMIAERMVMERARKDGKARYMIIRSGNILDSTGSVMDIWKHQIKNGNCIAVTHPDMKRFYTSVEGVVKLYIAVLERGESGKIYFTPQGEGIIIGEMAERAIKLYGNENTEIRYIGLRPGERMTEKMRSASEGNTIAGFGETVSLTTNVMADQNNQREIGQAV